MKNTFLLRSFFWMVGLGLFLTQCTAPAPPAPEDIAAEIQALNEEFSAAFARGDAAGVAARYTDDARIYPPNSEMIEGKAAIEAYWQGGMDAGLTGADLRTISATAYGKTALEIGEAMVYAGDGVQVDKSKFMVRWIKLDGEWKMQDDIWNSSMPAPPPPAPEEALSEEGMEE